MKSTGSASRLVVSLVAYAIWVAITILGGLWLSGGNQQALTKGLTSGLLWNVIAALAFLAIVIAVAGWRDLKFVAPKPWASLKIMWLPALYVVAFLTMAATLGLPPLSVIALVFVSTLFVGLSEETMFRGVLFQALRNCVQLWPAIILTSLLFGSVHILNAFTTGQLSASMLQALTATMSGFAFIAILIRTGSIWPAITYHALWDFGTFMMSASNSGGATVTEGAMTGPLAFFLPVLLVLPNFLYGLYLLRNVRNTTTLSTDGDTDWRAGR